jgi:hypothetical protein
VTIDIVDPGTWASRDWHIQEAFRDALDSYRNRSRDHNTCSWSRSPSRSLRRRPQGRFAVEAIDHSAGSSARRSTADVLRLHPAWLEHVTTNIPLTALSVKLS